MTLLRTTWLLAVALLAVPARAQLQTGAPPCATDPAFAMLDFWLGEWTVQVGGQRAGENRIQKIVDGCAITEDWTAGGGGRGHSLFYYHGASRTWKQVWVTGRALERGGVKEKTMTAQLPGGGVRFQGEIAVAGGRYLDRTTLTPLGPDQVRQLIEISTDGGLTWQTTFDGRYLRSGSREPTRERR